MTLQTAERIAHIAQTALFTVTALATMAGIILPLHAGLSPVWLAFLCAGGFLTGLCAGATVALLVNDAVSLWLYDQDNADLNLNTNGQE